MMSRNIRGGKAFVGEQKIRHSKKKRRYLKLKVWIKNKRRDYNHAKQ